MKLRKLLALLLTLSVCASLMAPLASAAFTDSVENEEKYETITVSPVISRGDGDLHSVKLTARMRLSSDGVAKTIAEYIASRDSAEKLSKVRFVCGLSAKNIASMAGTYEYELNENGQALFVADASRPDGAKGDDLIQFNLKLNPNKVTAWSSLTGSVSEIRDAIAADLAKEIVFTTSRENVQVTYGTVYAYVDVFIGNQTTAYAERIAWGKTLLADPDTIDDTGEEETQPTQPTTPSDDETPEVEPVVIDEDGNEQPADKPAAEVINSVDVKTVDENGKVDSHAPKAGERARLAFMPNKNVITHNGGRSTMVFKIVDPVSGKVLYSSAASGTPAGTTVTTGANGETVVTFTMPEDGAQFVVEYEALPFTPEETGVDALLNTDDHIAYINGDGNGNFRPNDKITRSEIAAMLYRLLRNKNVQTTVSFTDVKEDAWYHDAVMALASLGILKGSYGQFRPNDTITREEVTAICARFATVEPTVVGKEFADVSSADWAHDEIALASALGWVVGYPDGRFKPDNALTRAEAVTLLNRVLGRPGDSAAIRAGKGNSFSDIKSGDWFYNAVVEASTAHGYTMDDATYTETWKIG